MPITRDMGSSSLNRIAAALCLAAAPFLVLAPAGTAQPLSESSLVLTLHEGMDTSGPVIAEVTLKCGPTGGTHTEAEDACATVSAVDGNLEELGSTCEMCPMIYQPVTVEVGGNWRDKVVSFERHYENECVAGADSVGVFRF
jgi:hypothetical protein